MKILISGRASRSEDVDQKLREINPSKTSAIDVTKEAPKEKQVEETKDKKQVIEIFVYDEDDNEIPYEFYGEPKITEEEMLGEGEDAPVDTTETDDQDLETKSEEDIAAKVAKFVAEVNELKEERIEDMERTFDQIAATVNRFKSANYDLGYQKFHYEFVGHYLQAKPEEVEMVRQILQTFLDENMDVIVPELEEVEEEEQPIPDIVMVYSVPGIGPEVDSDIIHEFVEYALDVSKVQADMFMPRNIRHFMCPPLEKYEEYKYEIPAPRAPKEEVATGGIITD
ncbi:unnamed protein product [Diatraea saccharalis]|uniref:Uncharacterized protein n=1 Tax=Diatraea saccharalis TaxID=40085 RepID=A0A9N9RDG5_9NEOP|nr:unnamed protein product [Diatraea saccharalis]